MSGLRSGKELAVFEELADEFNAYSDNIAGEIIYGNDDADRTVDALDARAIQYTCTTANQKTVLMSKYCQK